jgi:hypothetical protein
MMKFLQKTKLWYRTRIYGPQITTIYGLRTEKDFIKQTGGFENDNERTSWVEYRDDDGTLVHRSAHVILKKMPEFASAVGAIG